MDYARIVNAVIYEGVEKAFTAYPSELTAAKRDGAIAGLEACRKKDSMELLALLHDARAWKEQCRSTHLQAEDESR